MPYKNIYIHCVKFHTVFFRKNISVYMYIRVAAWFWNDYNYLYLPHYCIKFCTALNILIFWSTVKDWSPQRIWYTCITVAIKLHIYIHTCILYMYLCIIFLEPLYGEGSWRLCLLPNPYYVLYIIKICLNKKKQATTLKSSFFLFKILCC